MRLHIALLLVLLLAGCSSPRQVADPIPSVAPAAPAPAYALNVVVSQETADGPRLPAEVQVVPVLGGGLGPMQVQGTDGNGVARFRFREPTEVLVRAVGPVGWTKEGARVQVGETLTAEGALASDRDLFLPLLRESLTVAVRHSWSTAAAEPRPDGSVTPAATFMPLALAEGLQAAYLSRLADALVTASWMDGADGRAGSLATGLAWDGEPWVVGAEASPLGAGAGTRTATWDGDLPADRPADLAGARLQAVLQTGTAVVGTVTIDVEATLWFGGRAPAEMPADDCHLLC